MQKIKFSLWRGNEGVFEFFRYKVRKILYAEKYRDFLSMEFLTETLKCEFSYSIKDFKFTDINRKCNYTLDLSKTIFKVIYL